MTKIIFFGWEVGFRPIPFIKLLHERCNLSLVEARILKNDLLNNKIIEIFVDIKEAKSILEEAELLKAKGCIV